MNERGIPVDMVDSCWFDVHMVPEAGLEPARSCLRGIFIPLRLWTPLFSQRLWSGLSLHLFSSNRLLRW